MLEGGELWPLLRTLIALIGVCALAWFSLNLLARRGIGMSRTGARVRLLERLALGPRRHLYLVQADTRVFLLGASESGALGLIAELNADARVPAAPIDDRGAGN
jgi:flagellar biogenesis protein FliO